MPRKTYQFDMENVVKEEIKDYLNFHFRRLVSEINHFLFLVLLFAVFVAVVSLVVAIAIVQMIIW